MSACNISCRLAGGPLHFTPSVHTPQTNRATQCKLCNAFHALQLQSTTSKLKAPFAASCCNLQQAAAAA